MLLVRVQDRSPLISHVGEVMGVTDRVLQFGEVVGLGPEWVTGRLRHLELSLGDLVVYPSPRIFDHFERGLPGKGACKVLVVPGYWVAAIVRGTFIADNPHHREYGRPLE